MLNEIEIATKKCQEAWKAHKASVQIKSLISQFTLDIQLLINAGDWDFALKLAHYRHEIAKTVNSLDWYDAYVEIRKTRDIISVLTDDRAETSSCSDPT